MDIWMYFAQKEREFKDLSLLPDRSYDALFAALEGSAGRRGRVFGNLFLAEWAYLRISELVVVVGKHVRRLEYAYYLIIDSEEWWGYERDPSHNPPVHCHTRGHEESRPASPITFKRAAEMAWEDVTEEAERVL